MDIDTINVLVKQTEASWSPRPLFGPLRTSELEVERASGWEFKMKHYRVNKLTKPAGLVVKTKDILAKDDRDAMQSARTDADCPVCEVFQAGKKVGAIT